MDIADGILVGLDAAFYTLAFRVKDVPVDRETVVRLSFVWGNDCPEAESWNEIIRIVVLQNRAHRLYSMEVLVSVRVQPMQRVATIRVPIRQSEVDSDRKADLTSAENVVKETVTLLELKLSEFEYSGLVCDTESIRDHKRCLACVDLG